MADLAGLAALVTGGGSGVGRATVLELASRGVRVLVADIDGDAGDVSAQLVREAGGIAVARVTDVTDVDQVDEMVRAALEEFGALDIAVNNAGITGPGAMTADYPIEAWRATMALNLDSVFYCLRAEIPAMLAGGGGAIVNVASGAGLVGFAGLPAYVASKHGVVGLTRAAGLEYARKGIRVNCVCPGSTRTPMLEAFMGEDEKVEKMMRAAVPLGRLGEPDEIAKSIVWLCSDEASFVVGHALAVDGGSVIQ
ncbi:MAG: glucose 1-dehydrogenase [Acidimicrobiia bacterium]|nr:glucose 1-dehydrogenase [Acidimicrobiia bacterium]